MYKVFQSELKKFENKYLSEEEVEKVEEIALKKEVKIDFAYHGSWGAPDERALIRGLIFPKKHIVANYHYMDASVFFSPGWEKKFKS